MSEIRDNNNRIVNEAMKYAPQKSAESSAITTVADILKRIDCIISENGYLKDAMNTIMHDTSDTQANAVKEIVVHRELTNRDMIGLLKEIYKDIRPKSEATKKDIIEFFRERLNCEENEDIRHQITETMLEKML